MPVLLEALNDLPSAEVDIAIADQEDALRLDRQVATVHFPGIDEKIDLGYPEQVSFKLRALQWRYPLVGLSGASMGLTVFADGMFKVLSTFTPGRLEQLDPKYFLSSGALEMVTGMIFFTAAMAW